MDLAGDGVDGTTKWHWTKRCIHARHCHAKVRSELREGAGDSSCYLVSPFPDQFSARPGVAIPLHQLTAMYSQSLTRLTHRCKTL